MEYSFCLSDEFVKKKGLQGDKISLEPFAIAPLNQIAQSVF
jgi:hypothetical protein